MGIDIPLHHIANSAALIHNREPTLTWCGPVLCSMVYIRIPGAGL